MIPPLDFHVDAAAWDSPDQIHLRHVREQVFLIEQECPEDEEWDALDASSRHVLARDRDGQPIGTGRLTPERRIGRVAVLAEWRGSGVGVAIMQRLIEQARASRWPAVELGAQTHAIPFYERLGFVTQGEEYLDCGIPHRSMRLDLAPIEEPPRAAPSPRPEVAALEARDRRGALEAVGTLLRQARHELAILTRDLDADLFEQPDSLDELKRIALSGHAARIRILVRDPREGAANAHRLVTLAQRLPSAFELRTPVEDLDRLYAPAFLLDDRGGLLFRPLGDRFEGTGSTCAPGRHAQLLALFEEMWQRAEPASELRALGI